MVSVLLLRFVSLFSFFSLRIFGCQAFRFGPDASSLSAHRRARSTTRVFYKDEKRQGGSIDIEQHRKNWISRSVDYYSKVMREDRRRNMGQVEGHDNPNYQDSFTALAARHYFALRKIKEGKLQHAEHIYRRIIDELLDEEDDHECDHAKLAVTTLLLALLMQRTGASAKQTRSVFLTFFRVVSMDEGKECACSAKVVGAFSLFEMKQGNTLKSLQLARRAFKMDPTVMHPLLHWKQFRDAAEQQQRFQQGSLSSPPQSTSE